MEEIIYLLFSDKGVFSHSPHNYPHLGEFREAVAQSKKIHTLIKDAILSRLDPILLRSSKIFCYRKGWTTEQLSKKNTLWELWDKSEPEIKLIAEVILMKEFTRRVSNKLPRNTTDLWCCFDDAQMLVTENSFIRHAIKVMRETGITLCMCVQGIADCDPAIIGNSGSRLVGICNHFPDLRNMCQSMGLLTYDQIQNVSRYLQTGVFLTQLSGGSEPFLLKFPAKPRNLILART